MKNMDYQYYDEPDYIDVDDDDADNGGHTENGFPYGYHNPSRLNPNQEDDDYYQDATAAERHLTLMERLSDNLENCVQPSLIQVAQYMAPMLILCLVSRILKQIYARRRGTVAQSEANCLSVAPLHVINSVCGIVLLYLTLGPRLGIILVLNVISYTLLQFVRLGNGQRGAIAIAALTIGSQFLYELAIWRQRQDWPQLRGIQMVANMKVISLAFDLTGSKDEITMPGPLAYLGYILNPATCLLGPWIRYAHYVESLVGNKGSHNWLRNLRQVILNVLLCLLTLAISNCLAPSLSEMTGSSHTLLMYTGALSVRTSHYFVCFLVQALLACADQRLEEEPTNSNWWLGHLVSRPGQIEWPRSLTSLVRSWNIPMHDWLKRYVYRGAMATGSSQHLLVSVFCTYLISSLLHGMDLRIYLVLLSLAAFGQGEMMLRRHLAQSFDACISANPCRGSELCRYSRCPAKPKCGFFVNLLIRFANLGFTLLVIYHLAYLGVVLLNESLSTDLDEESGSFMWHWSEAGYLSHYLGIGMFVLYLFIS
ncbi:uncharacterized protein Dwil_GK20006 [Drosophila willistoni]|uniref:Protein-serine O-palmitoleoyltransferase porcupine n=1 Tax=Drosophila willistoni TaxID=7260 RepID=B4MSN8_DROWI|nr:protein-serine O-palmitoleoyltransferase porcupine [Drosophila willistoni]EDW75127.2 uncharacterized protein Dwil_GK20006 [Drosophila willistoni]